MPAEDLRALYDRVHTIWEAERKHLFNGVCGYSILGSKPVLQPRLMLIGANPGFSADDVKIGEAHVHRDWPETSYLDGETWKFKERLKDLFSKAGKLEILRQSVVTNFNFFKSGSQSRESAYRWADLDSAVRTRIEQTCLTELRQLVRMVSPRKIMILGLDAFDQRADSRDRESLMHDGRRLVATGRFEDVDAFAIKHPSGARWSNLEKDMVANWLGSRLSL